MLAQLGCNHYGRKGKEKVEHLARLPNLPLLFGLNLLLQLVRLA